ncbi:hypothetical protein IEQ34_020655 [Dendrobium chrysotoxum]|uniref:Uncharacterized protein n=1 Tax=Dendrobium chrysotoxum TaxID=161865 RepID=A0AAV7G2K7_DENCH|nr:hypothetical protein IEQ34_020655 [Dendrobium chrysotoxum]
MRPRPGRRREVTPLLEQTTPFHLHGDKEVFQGSTIRPTAFRKAIRAEPSAARSAAAGEKK